ncbi:MAG: beta-galactosidase trimerization domain-containing protein, partial [Lachnospiraceae bacterium]|nr:beta-galactosidase trimerization domain-containing protein [Lachnospiraceae bacterium]
AVARSLKKDNYLVLETEAQGNVEWLAYPGQLRLSAYSHIANGASSVMYWNWHSIHNAIESYWKGVLSHDLTPHATYDEIKNFRQEFMPLEKKLKNLKKKANVGILVDNASLTGLDEFPISDELNYNAILRAFADSCHELNIEYDLLYKADSFDNYRLLIVPALYSASDEVLLKIKKYVKNGGHLLMSFKSAFSDDELKIYHDEQPHLLTECIGATYDMFTVPKNVDIEFDSKIYPATEWIELVTPKEAEIWASYKHQFWGNYAAITHNKYGDGTATYIGCYTEKCAIKKLLKKLSDVAKLPKSNLELPIIKKCGVNEEGKNITFYFNYSSDTQTFTLDSAEGTELLSNTPVSKESNITLKPWDLVIIESL